MKDMIEKDETGNDFQEVNKVECDAAPETKNDDIFEFNDSSKLSKRKKIIKESFLTKECKVLHYNPKEHTLDVKFDKYGVRLYDVFDFEYKDTVIVKYQSEIGRSDFVCKL